MMGALRFVTGTRVGVGILSAALAAAITLPMLLSARSDLAAAQDRLTQVRAELLGVTANRERLRLQLQEQTAAVSRLESEAKRLGEAAQQSAQDVLDRAEQDREADRATGAAAEDMNQWIRDLFSPH